MSLTEEGRIVWSYIEDASERLREKWEELCAEVGTAPPEGLLTHIIEELRDLAPEDKE